MGVNTPNIRFKGFTDDWEQCKLSTLCENITVGIANSATHAYRDNGIVMFRNQNIKENYLDDSDIIYIDEEFEKRYINKRLKANDLLIARTGYPGTACVVPAKYEGSQTFTTLIARLKTGTNPFFVCQYINSDYGKSYITATQIGGGQKNSGAGILEQFPMALPPTLDEQITIAEFLTKLDETVTLHQRKCDEVKELKKYMLQKMFPQEGQSVPEIRFAGFTDDWDQRQLNDYASFSRGSGLSWADVSDDGKQECVLYGNLYTDYGMIATDIKYKTSAILANPILSKYGDVLIPGSDTTPTGLARATSIEKSGVLLGGDINIVRPMGGINGSCLSLAINANKKELIKLIKGTTVRHIHNEDIKRIKVSLPKSLVEQERIVIVFKNLDNLIILHQRKCDEMKELKKYMLQNMFPQKG